ncbi:hypothetical protein [Caldiplasma sukawensis]
MWYTISAKIKEPVKIMKKYIAPSINVTFGESDLLGILLFLMNRKIGMIKVTSIKELITILTNGVFFPLSIELILLNKMKRVKIIAPMIEYLITAQFTISGNNRNISKVSKTMKMVVKYSHT